MAEQDVIRGPTIWHPAFYELIIERAPPTTEIQTEVELSKRPQRADLLLIRRKAEPPRDHEAAILRGLWPRLARYALAEFKGPTSGYRSGDLLTLFGYGVQFHRISLRQRFQYANELSLVIVTPAETPSIRADATYMGWQLERLNNGYARITGACYDILVAFTDEVHSAEHDDFLSLFSRAPSESREAFQWLSHYHARITNMEDVHKLEGFEELTDRLLKSCTPEQRVRGLRVEERLAGLRVEERLAGLRAEERLAGLRAEERLAGLSPEERAELRKLLDESE